MIWNISVIKLKAAKKVQHQQESKLNYGVRTYVCVYVCMCVAGFLRRVLCMVLSFVRDTRSITIKRRTKNKRIVLASGNTRSY